MSEITLYDSTSPFASEHWALMGLESQDALFSSSTALERNLLGVFGASLLVGIVIAGTGRLDILVPPAPPHGARCVRPDPEQPLEFASTGIVEIDELSDAIQTLGTEVAYSASRLSQILELSDRTIGAFEYNAETDAVTCTDGFFTTLSLLKHPDPRMESLLDGMTGNGDTARRVQPLVGGVLGKRGGRGSLGATCCPTPDRPAGCVSSSWRTRSRTACSASSRT